MWVQFVSKFTSEVDRVALTFRGWLGHHLFNIIVILVGAYLLRKFGVKLITQLINRTVRYDLFPTKADRKKRIKTLNSLIGATIKVGVWIIAGIMIVGEVGINTGPLIASASFLGLALGLGAQSLIKDFVSGIFIITENQYRVDDLVQLNAGAGIGATSGVVEAITIRTTVLRDYDGFLHHVPNGTIATTTNKTIGFGCINEDIAVGFDTDVDRLEHIINHAGEELLAMPEFKHKIHVAPHMSALKGFHDNGLIVNIAAKTAPSDQWMVRSEFYRLLKKAFDKHGVKMVPNQQALLHHSAFEAGK